MEHARVLLYAVVAAAGCYSPSYEDCAITCGTTSGATCPNGLSCDPQRNVCRIGGATGACPRDLADGGPGSGDGSGSSCWGYTTSNFDSCLLSSTMSSHDIEDAETVNTDTGAITSPNGTTLFGTIVMLQAGRPALFVHDVMFTIGTTGSLKLRGHAPLIIAAESTIAIHGVIDGTGATDNMDPDCPLVAIDGATDPGYGGYGGGFGGSGGFSGPPYQHMQGNAQITSNGTALLVPLRPGCPGTLGGGQGTSGGFAGSAGGAVELSSRTLVDVSGSLLYMDGTGGGAGQYDSTSTATGGGGGGGAGGAILLEAPSIQVDTASLCAAGGGGGQGAYSNTTPTSGNGGTGDTDCSGGPGGLVASYPGGAGGNGGGRFTSMDGAAGGSGTSVGAAGGGGGGSAGRIRWHGTPTGNATGVYPPPVIN